MTIEAELALTPQKPADTRPPNKPARPAAPPKQPSGPTKPNTGRLATDLDHAELLLRCVQVLVPDLDGMDPALRMQLASGLRTARRAVEAAQSPARRDLSGSGADPTAVATRGGPVHISGRDGKAASAESRPVQLATAETSDPAHAQVGAAAVVNPAGRPPLPGGDFLLPRDVRIGARS